MQEKLIKEEPGSNTYKQNSYYVYDISPLFMKLLPLLSSASLSSLEAGLKGGSSNNAIKLIIADIQVEKNKRKQANLSSI